VRGSLFERRCIAGTKASLRMESVIPPLRRVAEEVARSLLAEILQTRTYELGALI
jgi:hypothetical protein